jgi:hypothetical protein
LEVVTVRTTLNKIEAELAGCLTVLDGLKDIMGSPLQSVEDADAVLAKVEMILSKIMKRIQSVRRSLMN